MAGEQERIPACVVRPAVQVVPLVLETTHLLVGVETPTDISTTATHTTATRTSATRTAANLTSSATASRPATKRVITLVIKLAQIVDTTLEVEAEEVRAQAVTPIRMALPPTMVVLAETDTTPGMDFVVVLEAEETELNHREQMVLLVVAAEQLLVPAVRVGLEPVLLVV